MTPVDVLEELGLIALLMVGWTALVLLMLERDRKRTERRDGWTADRYTADSSGAGEPGPAATLNEESRPARRPEERTDARQS